MEKTVRRDVIVVKVEQPFVLILMEHATVKKTGMDLSVKNIVLKVLKMKNVLKF